MHRRNKQVQELKKSASDVRELSSHAGFTDYSNLQMSFLDENVKHNLQPSSSCHFEQDGTRGRGKDVLRAASILRAF